MQVVQHSSIPFTKSTPPPPPLPQTNIDGETDDDIEKSTLDPNSGETEVDIKKSTLDPNSGDAVESTDGTFGTGWSWFNGYKVHSS